MSKPDWQAFLRLAAQCDDHHVYAAAACEIAPLAVRRVLRLEAALRHVVNTNWECDCAAPDACYHTRVKQIAEEALRGD